MFIDEVFPRIFKSFYHNIQAFVVQVGARECVYAIDSNDGDSIRLQHIIQRSGMLLTEAKKSSFHTKLVLVG